MRRPDQRQRIRHLHRVKRSLADGRAVWHFYHRVSRVPLPDPNDPRFAEAYAAAERAVQNRENADMQGGCANVHSNNRVANSLELLPDNELEARRHDPTASAAAGASPAPSPLYLTPEEVSERWRKKVDVETLKNWRSLRIGPTFHRFGRAVFYSIDILEAWESQNIVACDPLPQLNVPRHDDESV